MNVLLIVIDSLRADHLGCYGYAKNTSPQIDAFARESTLFTRTFAPGIPTTPAFTTLLTGLHPYHHGILSHGGDALLRPEVVTLPQLAKQTGYTTIGIDNLAVQGNGRGSWFSRGFDYYSGYTYQPFGEQDANLADRAIRYLQEFRREKFLLFLHLWAPHTPYAPPKPFDTLHYDGASTPAVKLQNIKSLAPEYYESFLGDMKLEKPDDLDWIMAQYHGEISFADAQVGRVLEKVRELGLYDETLVVVMSDHGECFGEGGFWFDHHGLYDANMRVASVWRVPGKSTSATQQCNDLLSTEDVMPTLCGLCDWPLPEYSITGRSFAPVFENVGASREQIVGVECSRQASLCLRTEDWKLLVPVTRDARGEEVPDFYGQPRDGKVLLFDLKTDPQELQDVSAKFPQMRDELYRKLEAWRAEESARCGGRDPLLDTPLGLPIETFLSRVHQRRK